jgi:signal peptidase I
MDNNNPFLQVTEEKKKRNIFITILQPIAIVAILLIMSWFILLGQNQVDGPSMRSNFYTGEFLILNRVPAIIGEGPSKALGINYERGDIVVLKKPGLPEFVKRVIALEGETINLAKGRVFINGKVMEEDYLPVELYTNGGDYLKDGGAGIEVPKGYIFTIGDNRPESEDSRYEEIGLVKREWVKGKVFLRIWPFNTFTFIPRGTYRFIDENKYDFSKIDQEFRNPVKRTGECNTLAQCF